ncbi:MAG: hypothetical protein WD872_21755 [Pirellulaceae bacterium]
MSVSKGCIALALLFGGLILFCGCDLGGTYSARYEASLASVGQRAALNEKLCAAPTAVTDAATKPVGVSLRLPALFAEYSNSLAATEPRALPPAVKLPGFSYAIERLVDDPADPKKFAPVYCYLAAVPKGDQKADALQAEVQTQLSAAFAGAAWQDVQLTSPAGEPVAVRLISVKGQQEFSNTRPDNATLQLDGQMDIYFYEGPEHFVFIGFRAPTAQAVKYTFFEDARVAMTTIGQE